MITPTCLSFLSVSDRVARCVAPRSLASSPGTWFCAVAVSHTQSWHVLRLSWRMERALQDVITLFADLQGTALLRDMLGAHGEARHRSMIAALQAAERAGNLTQH